MSHESKSIGIGNINLKQVFQNPPPKTQLSTKNKAPIRNDCKIIQLEPLRDRFLCKLKGCGGAKLVQPLSEHIFLNPNQHCDDSVAASVTVLGEVVQEPRKTKFARRCPFSDRSGP